MTFEKLTERRLVRVVRQVNGQCIKLLPFLETGLPDRLCILPGGRHIYVELKTPGNDLSPKQRIWRNRLLKMGCEYYKIDAEKDYLCLENRIYELTLI